VSEAAVSQGPPGPAGGGRSALPRPARPWARAEPATHRVAAAQGVLVQGWWLVPGRRVLAPGRV